MSSDREGEVIVDAHVHLFSEDRTAFPLAPRHDLPPPPRLMWGSNWPMDLPSPSYLERLDALRTHFPFLTPDKRASILGRTALSLWALAGSEL